MASIGKNFNQYSTFNKQIKPNIKVLKGDGAEYKSEQKGWQAVIKAGDKLDNKEVREAFEAGNSFLVIFHDGTQRAFPLERLAK